MNLWSIWCEGGNEYSGDGTGDITVVTGFCGIPLTPSFYWQVSSPGSDRLKSVRHGHCTRVGPVQPATQRAQAISGITGETRARAIEVL